jgi:LysR family hydrogen peroxide-inducible transcriptional activator
MELHQIRYFRAVAECHSFTRAAIREHVSQPTLSHQILKLEDELQAKLFSRLGHTVGLTPFGEAFLPKAEIILRQIEEARNRIRDIAGIEGGRVTVGIIPTITPFFLPQLLSKFFDQHPLLEVKVLEEPRPTLMRWLQDGDIDVAILPLPIPGRWATWCELSHEKLYAVLCPGHALENEKHVTLKQLSGSPFLFLKDGHCFREKALTVFRQAKVEPRIIFEMGCFLTILNMVKAGIGISVVPEMAVNESSGCKFVPIKSDRPVRIVALAYSKLRFQTRAQELFVQFAKQHSENPGQSENTTALRRRIRGVRSRSVVTA